MAVEDITNYLKVSETLTSSGQPTEMEFKAIAEAGFEVVINLTMPNSENVIPEEGYIVTARGMSYTHLPIPYDAPSGEHLKTFLGIMDAFAGKKCWVHCVVNQRVSAFLFQYHKLVLGMSDEDARKVIIPGWQPENVWREFMALKKQDIGR